jgi:hypothetical protein
VFEDSARLYQQRIADYAASWLRQLENSMNMISVFEQTFGNGREVWWLAWSRDDESIITLDAYKTKYFKTLKYICFGTTQ